MIGIEIRADSLADPVTVIPGELVAAVTEIVALLERNVKRRTPVGVSGGGGLRGSIAGEVRQASSMGVGVPIGRVGSPLPYALVVERGRQPGKMPPPEALELWVRRKLGVQNVNEARSVAYLIARKIGREGTEGAHMFRYAAQHNESTIRRILEQSGVRMTVDFAKGM
ncbi:MAG TPA: hypothetical protein VFI91_13275 [Longimicrobiaceae bacterium]|nr:hypothetical protein [Longimicrobiaceae bacterium]